MEPNISPNHKEQVPHHYGTLGGFLRSLGKGYLKALDSTVRVLGFYIISGIFFLVLGSLMGLLLSQMGGGPAGKTIAVALGLLFAPPIIHISVVGAGLRQKQKNP